MFFGFTLEKVLNLSTVPAVIMVALYVALSLRLGSFGPEVLNGSLACAKALLGLAASGIRLRRLRHLPARYCLFAGCIFVVALLLRTVDLEVCDSMANGTHSMWHLLIAVLLLLLLRVCIEHYRCVPIPDALLAR